METGMEFRSVRVAEDSSVPSSFLHPAHSGMKGTVQRTVYIPLRTEVTILRPAGREDFSKGSSCRKTY